MTIIPTEIIQKLQASQAWNYKVIPYESSNKELKLYGVSQECRSDLELITGKVISIELIEEEKILRLLSQYYRKAKDENQLKELEFGPNFLNDLIAEAKQTGSSDIHIESLESKCRVRYRIDGKLMERIILNKSDYPELVNKVKILANLDIAEKRLPQDGRISYQYDKSKFDLRVSVLPTMFGEKIVMRILGSDAKDLKLDEIGLEPEDLLEYRKSIQKPHGIIMISGPTGHGKTTTLYASLNLLNDVNSNILTIEDPIEYTLEGINQVQLKESIGLDFTKALKTFLRQDPDIIMVGEIRDKATADMAIRAALTGHLVLSTIHTNSALGTISRLADMGIPKFLIAETLNISVSQRLVRLLCKNCKQKVTIQKNEIPPRYFEHLESEIAYKSLGCESCHYTGYAGRRAVFELLPIDEDLREAVKSDNISYNFTPPSFRTLGDKCFQLYMKGETSLEEVYPFLISN